MAPGMRGYGRTDAPEAIDRYTLLHLVGDVIGWIEALGEKEGCDCGTRLGSTGCMACRSLPSGHLPRSHWPERALPAARTVCADDNCLEVHCHSFSPS